MGLYKLIEKEAGDVLYKKEFSRHCDRDAEQFQAERWNEFYCMGEPRVSSRLYKFLNSRWHLLMSMGV